ncbi:MULTISPECIES: hypothetical protein [unclassified Aureimonas]|uniref:hypothetical protein n=1 Tax=unclassified Aureimonas TaxID=2615206 RepID=UPI0006F95242|nr:MULTISPECIES: hypothetical protein [unclassified Aureimonas]KQT64559.1 hypothetical protein ASG62_05540 [Aureimonas sp. Leaf427]KQT81746.1 hypothetical protein ASG54_02820 [Aureimonas sp. Leaf460]
MTRLRLSTIAAQAILLAAAFGAAPVRADSYEALSTTAMGITGDIDFDDSGITFENGKHLDFSDLVADEIRVDGVVKPASVYAIAEPANPELNGGNTLCDRDVTYLANWLDEDGETDWIAAFTGEDAPTSTENLCASFTYVAKN